VHSDKGDQGARAHAQIVVGLKTGELALYDVATSTQLATYKAHTGAVWGVHVRPDGRGLVSGSADKDVKFWDFEMSEVEGEKVVSRLGVESTVSADACAAPRAS
jgi:U3 small nucleolar RNA-associated protein 12